MSRPLSLPERASLSLPEQASEACSGRLREARSGRLRALFSLPERASEHNALEQQGSQLRTTRPQSLRASEPPRPRPLLCPLLALMLRLRLSFIPRHPPTVNLPSRADGSAVSRTFRVGRTRCVCIIKTSIYTRRPTANQQLRLETAGSEEGVGWVFCELSNVWKQDQKTLPVGFS